MNRQVWIAFCLGLYCLVLSPGRLTAADKRILYAPDIVGVETESSYGQLGGDKDLARYRMIRQRLTDAALSEQESLALIHKEASR